MKAPKFWYKPTGLTAVLLLPVSLLYSAGSKFRRALTTPYRAKIPVVCIGNIVAGGAGKTPVALELAQALRAKGHKPVFVTRGYGGKECGPLRVDLARHTARDVGDEALLLARVAPVWIGHDRPAAIRKAEEQGSHIILDDGLQNPGVLPNIVFLVVDGATAFGNEHLIPAGPLRESFESGMSRTTAVVLIGPDVGGRILPRVRCPVIKGQWVAQLPPDFPVTQSFFDFAGIGRPEKFYTTCREAKLDLAGTKDFPDHHMFSAADINDLKKQANALGAQLLTTEKDWVRLPKDFQATVMVLPAKLVFDDVGALEAVLKI